MTENNSSNSKAIKPAVVTWADRVRYGSRTVEDEHGSGMKKINVCALGRVRRKLNQDKYVRTEKNLDNKRVRT